jgi:hypothetical protein
VIIIATDGGKHEPHDPTADTLSLAALEVLFGKGGASNGCWCMYWRIGAAQAAAREK